ncbi:AlpA family transcriptional regulator [Pantoea agglomerans]|jgi:prophage regulatory protein|nr:AlpA family transcriptional regulator [Pantoea agglomerans]
MHAASSVPAPAIPVIRDAVYPRDRFMRLPEVISTCGLSRSTIYDLISREQFPSQISLGGKNVAWLASEIDGWMQARIAKRAGGAA